MSHKHYELFGFPWPLPSTSFIPVHAHERQEEATEAAVDMHTNATLLGKGGQLADRVDHALRVARRRAGDLSSKTNKSKAKRNERVGEGGETENE